MKGKKKKIFTLSIIIILLALVLAVGMIFIKCYLGKDKLFNHKDYNIYTNNLKDFNNKIYASNNKDIAYLLVNDSVKMIKGNKIIDAGILSASNINFSSDSLYYVETKENEDNDIRILSEYSNNKKDNLKKNIDNYIKYNDDIYTYYDNKVDKTVFTRLKDNKKFIISNIDKSTIIFKDENCFYYVEDSSGASPYICKYNISSGSKSYVFSIYSLVSASKYKKDDISYNISQFNIVDNKLYVIVQYKNEYRYYEYNLDTDVKKLINRVDMTGGSLLKKCYFTDKNIYFVSSNNKGYEVYKTTYDKNAKQESFIKIDVEEGVDTNLNVLMINNKNILMLLSKDYDTNTLYLYNNDGSIVERREIK